MAIGPSTLTIGSTELFELSAMLDGQLWNLVGGVVTLTLADPNGTKTIINATSIYNGGAQAPWTVAGTAGNWKRAWTVTDANGVTQVSLPQSFIVISSPV